MSRQSCAAVAKELGLGDRLLEHAGDAPADELQRISRSRNVLAAVLEAAIAAVYLEHGFEAMEPALVEAFSERIEYARSSHVDYKTELQEALARSGRHVHYTVVEVEGPPHDRQFVCAAHVAGEQLGVGRARRRRPLSRRPRARRSRRSASCPSGSSRHRGGPRFAVRSGRENAASVHLRSLRIRGFKSFPDTLEISLEPGVAVIVGPNGSGKSNIADAIVWAAGSLTPSELRAEKPDDVLFAGGGDRKAAAHCEVELVFDNEDGTWPDLDFSEVSIARRLVRGAEGQYLVNRAAVRRTDLVEILSDVGLGSAMHSIVGQGKVEQVLASRPEDRRAFVEEAAGLGKFKRRRHRAELKLARVALQVERARDVEEEVRKRLRPLALQATAAERAEKLAPRDRGPARASRAARSDRVRSSRRAEAEQRRDAVTFSKRGAQGRLEGVLADRARAEEELSDAAGRREAAVAARYRLQSGVERLELRMESASALVERFGAEAPAADEPEAAERARASRARCSTSGRRRADCRARAHRARRTC